MAAAVFACLDKAAEDFAAVADFAAVVDFAVVVDFVPDGLSAIAADFVVADSYMTAVANQQAAGVVTRDMVVVDSAEVSLCMTAADFVVVSSMVLADSAFQTVLKVVGPPVPAFVAVRDVVDPLVPALPVRVVSVRLVRVVSVRFVPVVSDRPVLSCPVQDVADRLVPALPVPLVDVRTIPVPAAAERERSVLVVPTAPANLLDANSCMTDSDFALRMDSLVQHQVHPMQDFAVASQMVAKLVVPQTAADFADLLVSNVGRVETLMVAVFVGARHRVTEHVP